jgi:hypothetical protein
VPKFAWTRKSWNYFLKTCPNLHETFLKVRKIAQHNPKCALAFKFTKSEVKLIPCLIFGLTSPLFEFYPQSWEVLQGADFRGWKLVRGWARDWSGCDFMDNFNILPFFTFLCFILVGKWFKVL